MHQPPPHDLETERAVLGSMLCSCEKIDDVRVLLQPEDFYQYGHQVLYRQILRLADRSGVKSVDLVTLANLCASDKVTAEIGGWVYLADLVKDAPVAANAGHYAKTVKQYSIRRQLMIIAKQIMEEAQDPADPDELLNVCERKILSVRESRQSSIKTLQQCGMEVLDRADQVCNDKLIGIKTGILDLDDLVLIKPEDFVIFAARPSVGKSIAGGQIATHVAKQDLGVFFASVEMPGVDIAGRVMSLISSIDASVTAGRRAPNSREVEHLSASYSELPGKFWIDDSSLQGVPEISANARRLHRQHGLGLIVVDYLQLLEVHQLKGQTRAEALGQVSRGLKRLARELKVPVIALAQLNREAEGEPQLHHLRESGDFEQDADQVWLAWKDEEYEGSNIVWIKVGKQRGGPTGTVKVFHRKEYMRFDHHAAGLQPTQQPLFGGK